MVMCGNAGLHGCWVHESMKRDCSLRLFQAGRDSALHHERGEKSWRTKNAVSAVDQYPFTIVRLLLQPVQSFSQVLGRHRSAVGC